MAEASRDSRREIQAEPGLTEEERTKQAWAKRNLLTLDGGGIRGYWSLLALKQLMKRIGDEEIRQDKNATHSYYPLEWLPDTTHDDLEDRNTTSKRACSVKDPVRSLGQAQRYLPCHYFDFIGGSSTGGLIAIMLGRLRMTVEDCLEEYEHLSDRIFGNPRHVTTLRYLVLNRNKYDTQPVEAVFKDVSNRKGEHRAGEDFAPHEFCSATGICQTTVVTWRSKKEAAAVVDTRYFIRSYDFYPHDQSSSASRGPTRARTFRSEDSQRRRSTRSHDAMRGSRRDHNEGKAHKFEIWKVARAATAAPFYFDPLEVETPDDHFTFSDGGLGITNNPTKALVEHLEKHITVPRDADYGKLQAVVSIGTARHDASQHREYERLSQRVKGVYDKWSDPQDVHREMLSDYVEKRTHQYDYFFYYRLNPNVSNHQHLLDLDLDDWRPKGRKKAGLNPGCDTLKTIRDVFHDWFTNDPDANALFSECAEELVSQRRARVRDAEKWERYAHCTSYECDGACGQRASFALRTEFCRHIHESHGIPLRDAKGIADDRRETWTYKPRRDPSDMKLSMWSRLRAARRRVLGG